MVNEIRNKIILALENNFSTEQLQMIDMAVAKALVGLKVEREETLPSTQVQEIPQEIYEFFARKRLKGCSLGTLEQYKYVIKEFFAWLNKDIKSVKDIDILAFLDYRMNVRKLSKRTVDGNRLVLSSFYTYMHDTGKMSYNPMATIDRIKFKEKVREPLNDMELEKVRNACLTLREKALFEVLYSTGARVSEIVKINYSGIDFENRSLIVTGKGDQERYVFLNAKAIVAIQNYKAERKDNSDALFVSIKKPFNRLGKAAVEAIIRDIGKRSGIGRNVFPHLMRHTFATDMLGHGADINVVSKLLGHKKMETTQIYAKTSREMLENAHKKHVA